MQTKDAPGAGALLLYTGTPDPESRTEPPINDKERAQRAQKEREAELEQELETAKAEFEVTLACVTAEAGEEAGRLRKEVEEATARLASARESNKRGADSADSADSATGIAKLESALAGSERALAASKIAHNAALAREKKEAERDVRDLMQKIETTKADDEAVRSRSLETMAADNARKEASLREIQQNARNARKSTSRGLKTRGLLVKRAAAVSPATADALRRFKGATSVERLSSVLRTKMVDVVTGPSSGYVDAVRVALHTAAWFFLYYVRH